MGRSTLLEAMAVGCYCISHFWDGVEEFLPTENIYSTDQEMRENLIKYFNLPNSLKQELKDELRRLATEKFDIETTKSAFREIINQFSCNKGI